MWSVISGYIIVASCTAATVFTSNYATGTGCPNLVKSAAARAAIGLFWPYLALLVLRWVFLGGHFYYVYLPADPSRPSCSLYMASPVSLFEYNGWVFARG